MNAAASFQHGYEPQPLLSGRQHAGIAAAVIAAVLLAWAGMEQASHSALASAEHTYSQGRTHVTFQTVQITGYRANKKAS